jgi:hypothetical protein
LSVFNQSERKCLNRDGAFAADLASRAQKTAKSCRLCCVASIVNYRTADMLPVLRRRPAQILVALLCALVLSRMPAPVFGEDAAATIVKVEESAALAALAVIALPNVDSGNDPSAIATLVRRLAPVEPASVSLLQFAILRL